MYLYTIYFTCWTIGVKIARLYFTHCIFKISTVSCVIVLSGYMSMFTSIQKKIERVLKKKKRDKPVGFACKIHPQNSDLE